tara:strand:+ start:45 stop:704 length:660 start_codon:yes stop_codon:yes gene_type:complete
MIDKRIKYRYGGDTMGGPNDRSPKGISGPAGGASAGGNYGGNRNEEQTYGGGDKGSSGITGAKSASAFTDVTKDVLNPQKDFFTQSYKAPGIFGLGGGYKNLNIPGDTSQGFKQGIGTKILGGILGLISPFLGLGYRAITSAPGVFNKFKSSSTLEEFRDKMKGFGRTIPVINNNPSFDFKGIRSLDNEESLQAYLDYLNNTPDDPITFEQFLMQTGLK